MLSAQTACALVLALHDGVINDEKAEHFVIAAGARTIKFQHPAPELFRSIEQDLG